MLSRHFLSPFSASHWVTIDWPCVIVLHNTRPFLQQTEQLMRCWCGVEWRGGTESCRKLEDWLPIQWSHWCLLISQSWSVDSTHNWAAAAGWERGVRTDTFLKSCFFLTCFIHLFWQWCYCVFPVQISFIPGTGNFCVRKKNFHSSLTALKEYDND